MYNVCINTEFKKSIIVNFEEMIELYPDSKDECRDIISLTESEFSKEIESVDEPQDAYYIIDCVNEDVAETIESYLESKFSQLEMELED